MLSQNQFIHHVYFWLQNPGSQEDTHSLIEGMKSLTGISTIVTSHIGKPAATDRGVIDTSYSLSWLIVFNSKEEQDQYQTDPVHLKIVNTYGKEW